MLDAVQATPSFVNSPPTTSQRLAPSIWEGRMRRDRSALAVLHTLQLVLI